MTVLRIKREFLFFFALFFMPVVILQQLVFAEEIPLKVVEKTVGEILDVVKNQELSKPGNRAKRQKLIKETVAKRFDYREMSKQTLARHWKARTPEEQEKFVALFSQLLEKTYISKIESFSDEEIVYKEQLIKGKKAMVRSFIVKTDKEIAMIYKLKNTNGKWMVYGVVIEGVSLIRNYRTQFESIIDKENYAGLLKRLEEKIEKAEIS